MFGFSPYMLAHLMGHLSLIVVFPVPLAVYLIVLRVEGRISGLSFVGLMGVLTVVFFLCSPELLAIMVVMGACTLAAALLVVRPVFHKDLVEICALTGIALAIGSVFLTPFLYFAFSHGFPRGPINSPDMYSTDLLSFFIPSPILLIGRPLQAASLTMPATAGWAEDTAYIGIPLLLATIDYGLAEWRSPQARVMLVALGIVALASLGPRLHIAGTLTVQLPWAIATRLPLLDKALPGRFMMFAFLDLGLVISIYLSTSPHRVRKWCLALLSILCLIPNLPAGWWFARLETPRFFADGTFKRYLKKGEITLIFPYGRRGNSMLWQAQTDMYFRMAGGYVGLDSSEFQRWPVFDSLFSGAPCFDFSQQLRMFLAAHGVSTVILAQDAREIWTPLLAPIGLNRYEVEDVILYRVRSEGSVKFAAMTLNQARQRVDLVAFSAMAAAANEYWDRGLPISNLTPWEASRRSLLVLPPSTVGPNPTFPQWWGNLWLGEIGDSRVGIGVVGSYADIQPVIQKYGPLAKQILFPYPANYHPARSPHDSGQLLMIFDRDALQRAARISESNRPQHQ